MGLNAHFQLLARYNRIANERLFAVCATLDPIEHKLPRSGSFGSIHALLNHMLLGDRIWMGRFEGGQTTTPALNTVLFEAFPSLQAARAEEDARIEAFFQHPSDDFWTKPLAYINNQGKPYSEEPVVAVSHFFNHQTHHRGQVHTMLSQVPIKPPSLDLHRIINP